jgi:opacity protein-like surface antigen
MRMNRILIAAAAACVLLSAAPARAAEWFATPFFGGNFGGATDQPLFGKPEAMTNPSTFGITGGWTGGGWFGVEGDVAYAPSFFDSDNGFIAKRSLTTVMGNVRVAVPFGGKAGKLRPYVSGGAGLLRPNLAEAGDGAVVTGNKFAWNVGGGLTGMLNERVGITGDVRYTRAMDKNEEPNAFGVKFDGLDFWRGAIGVTLKW